MLPMMRVANSLVPTLVAPAVWRSKSYVTNFWRIVFSIDCLYQLGSFLPADEIEQHDA